MIELAVGLILIGLGAVFVIGGIAVAVAALMAIFKPVDDPYDPYTDENGNRTGLGVTYP